jgi:hypothetical protein
MSEGTPESTGSHDDNLRAALEAWVEDATSHVAADIATFVQIRSGERWQLGDDGNYRRTVFSRHVLSHDGVERLKQLPTYARLEEAAHASPVIGPLLGQLVGSGMGLSQFELWQLADAALPPVAEIVAGSVSSPFRERYDQLMSEVTRSEAMYVTLCFVQGASFEEDQISLNSKLKIARLAPPEIEAALDSGLLTPIFAGAPIFQPQDGAAFALKRTDSIPRIIGSAISEAERDAAMKIQDLSEDTEQLLQSLSLITSERISITGQSTFREHSDFTTLGKASWFRSYPAPRPFTGPGHRFDAVNCQELQNIWTLAHNESLPQNKALALALRRLGFATQRDRPEDRLLDIFIASEAFYLTDSAGDAKDRGELKYRLALRAAVWSEGTLDGWTKRQVFQHMRRGYDVRSTIAHGGEPNPTDLKVKDERVDLRAFVHTTENIVRAALYKALRQASGTSTRLVIPWDDLILPDS